MLIPSSAEEPIPKLRTERNRIPRKNEFERNSLNIEQNIFLPGWWKPIRPDSTRTHNLTTVGDCHYRVLFRVVFSAAKWFGTEFRVVFSSPEGFGREFREFACISVLLNGIPSCFLLRWRVRKGRLCFYFCSAERNSELFSLPLKGSERKTLLLFLFRGTEFRVVFSSTQGFEAEFWEFSVLRNSRNSVAITTCSVNSADVNFCNHRAHLWVWICPKDKQYDGYRQGMKSRFLLW